MASIYALKPRFQALLRPLTRALAQRGISANQITVLALVMSMLAGACIALWPHAAWPLLMVPAILFVRMALNAIDGMLAREHNLKSALGGLLNEVTDVLSDAALYLPFGLLPGVSLLWVSVVVILSVMTEVVGLAAVQIGATRRYDGPMGKSDRAFVFGCLAVVMGLGVPAGAWLNVMWLVLCVLLCWTMLNRMKQALLEVSQAHV